MSTQMTHQNDATKLVGALQSEQQLIQEDDPLFAYLPNVQVLNCNQIGLELMQLRSTFFNEIRYVGNATSNLKTFKSKYECAPKTVCLNEYLQAKKINLLMNQESSEDKKTLKTAIQKCFMAYVVLYSASDYHYLHHCRTEKSSKRNSCTQQVTP